MVNKKTRKRLILVTLVIVVVLALVLAFVGSGGASKSVSVADAATSISANEKIQVSGTVVDNSFKTEGTTLSFTIYDPDANDDVTLDVVYDGSISATFGNGVIAICTGKLDENGVLRATEMVTKCPSKYASAEGAVTAEYLIERGDAMVGQEVNLAGYVKSGTLVPAGEGDRFVVYSQNGEISVLYDGALATGIEEESAVVVTGALNAEGKFVATDVAMEEVQ